MNHHRLGKFELVFGPEGKLTCLAYSGGENVLHESTQAVALAAGKTFSPGGWDECFPTIEPHAGFAGMGDVIGRTPVLQSSSDSVMQTWHTDLYHAVRRFEAIGHQALQVSFQVQWLGTQPVEFLWASHALFTCRTLTEVNLPDGSRMDRFHPNGTEVKSFHPSGTPLRLKFPFATLQMTTDQAWWGVWLNRGGWPEGQPDSGSCIGIEATNTPGERPAGCWLAPQETFVGKVQLEIRLIGN
jgi:hypothetical protein